MLRRYCVCTRQSFCLSRHSALHPPSSPHFPCVVGRTIWNTKHGNVSRRWRFTGRLRSLTMPRWITRWNQKLERKRKSRRKKNLETKRTRTTPLSPTLVKSSTHCSARSEKEKRNICHTTPFRLFITNKQLPSHDLSILSLPRLSSSSRKKERKKKKKRNKKRRDAPSLSRSRNVHSHVSVSKLRVQKNCLYIPPLLPLLYTLFSLCPLICV